MDQVLEWLKVAYEPRPAELKAHESGSGLGWLWLPIVAVPALGLGYAALRRRSRRRAKLALQRTNKKGGFRSWAAAHDPSPVPKTRQKCQGITRAEKRPAKGNRKGSKRGAGGTPHYGYEPSGYSSSSS